MAYLDFEKPLVELETRLAHLRDAAAGRPEDADLERELGRLAERVEVLQGQLYARLDVWQKVQLSRHPDRPYLLDVLERIVDDVLELHGDRRFRDDAAIVAGFARLDGRSVAVVGHQKGRTTREKVRRNFGMAHPDGYRKAMRVMALAARFGRPVLTFIDTPGAYPGIGAEERGQSEAIGASLALMSQLPVPVIATVLGEGGSGGALALGVANRVLMMEYATYSVITPEGCASILWRDGSKAPAAAEQLRLQASDAAKLGIVDEVLAEPRGGAHRDPDAAAGALAKAIRRHLAELSTLDGDALIDDRYRRFRRLGVQHEAG